MVLCLPNRTLVLLTDETTWQATSQIYVRPREECIYVGEKTNAPAKVKKKNRDELKKRKRKIEMKKHSALSQIWVLSRPDDMLWVL